MQLIDFSIASLPAKRLHLIGITGAGMKALAEYLHHAGCSISGSDSNPDPHVANSLSRRGIQLYSGHDPSQITSEVEGILYSAAIRADNAERIRGTELNIPQMSYVEVLAELSKRFQSVCIAGTHGKSSTSAMLGQILHSAQSQASLICGAESIALGSSGWLGISSTLVVEACEFQRHFLKLHPQIGVILGIEPDHFDCYPTLADACESYEHFARNIPKNGLLISRSDCVETAKFSRFLQCRKVSFSLTDCNADWTLENRRIDGTSSRFQIRFRDQLSPEITLRAPGLHNVQNGLAAAACAHELGLSLTEIATGLNDFLGIRRRFEIRHPWRESIIVDDYAHHPTEIRATIRAAREIFPGKRLITVFQPHQISRTLGLLDEFAAALDLSDQTYLLPVYAARENSAKKEAETSQKVIQRMTSPAMLISALDRVWGTLQTDANKAAVILTLGAGDISRIHHDDIDETWRSHPLQ
ncbi:UDP-N-acetylmuramate--L-alanine ligase [Planctomicrobium sp. SH668]|uniref:UDP-N-acetylmuramate--L-alanine ligase n=1 Tax=Planctomicrobium sp. SH668 TaxID=3448126 RepID=UPI003F5C4182